MSREFKIGAAVGSGVVARAAQQGGAHFLLAIHAGRMRNMGAPSIASMLPIADAVATTLDFAEHEVLPLSEMPTYVGLCLWSPAYDRQSLLRTVIETGYAGAVNYPGAMQYAPDMQRLLDQHGLGVDAEIALLQDVQRAGRKGVFYSGSREHAKAAARAGIDTIIHNFGWNVGGRIGHRTEISLEEAAHIARDIVRIVHGIRPETEVYLEGGPILTAEDLNFVMRFAAIDGYVGGSTIDRFPVENSVANQIAEYKSASNQPSMHTQNMRDAVREVARYGLVGEAKEFTHFATALMRARTSKMPVVIRGPEGVNLNAALEAMLGPAKRRQSIRYFDFFEASSAHHINNVLFGRSGSGRRGVLCAGADIVVLLNAQAAPKSD